MAAAHTLDGRLEVKASAFAIPQCDGGHAAARRDLGIMINDRCEPGQLCTKVALAHHGLRVLFEREILSWSPYKAV